MPGLFGDEATLQQVAPGARANAAAYRVLARKYRPADFSDLIGQESMVRTLRNAFAINRIAHAFMLTGVRGVGKTTTARIIARALNCTGPHGDGGPTAEPCGVCPNCRDILADRHPDVVEMDAASRTGVDDVREIIEATRFRPMQARTKVFIVDEVHMLSRNAFNALLKTLEEPPEHVKFIFATTEWRKVPVTVLSRCQRFDLRRVSVSELSSRFARITELEGALASNEALDMIARASDGSVRDGLSLLDQAIALGAGRADDAMSGTKTTVISAELVADMLGLADRASVFALMEAVVAGQVADVLALTDRAHELGADLGLLLGDLLELSHVLTRLRCVPSLRNSTDMPELERTRGATLADRLSIPTLARVWQVLLKGSAEVEAASDRRAAAEMVLIRLCHLADLPSPAELVRELKPRQTPVTDRPVPPRSTTPTTRLSRGASLAQQTVAQPEAFSTYLPSPMPASLREVAALAAAEREPLLSGHLQHSVHLVRFAPPVIEIRPEPAAPRDLATRLGAVLLAATGIRWTIAVSAAAGEPTIADQDAAVATARRRSAGDHPLVRAVLEAFPGAVLRSTNHISQTEDAPPPPAPSDDLDVAMPEFAPPDAEFDAPMEADL